jgi:hypothetical protein
MWIDRSQFGSGEWLKLSILGESLQIDRQPSLVSEIDPIEGHPETLQSFIAAEIVIRRSPLSNWTPCSAYIRALAISLRSSPSPGGAPKVDLDGFKVGWHACKQTIVAALIAFPAL